MFPPTPEKLRSQFIIPRPYMNMIAFWLGLSISMTYQVLRQNRKPAPKTAQEIYARTGLPTSIWEETNIDVLADNVYTHWYNTQILPDQLKKLFEGE